jgi:hypothetical protein
MTPINFLNTIYALASEFYNELQEKFLYFIRTSDVGLMRINKAVYIQDLQDKINAHPDIKKQVNKLAVYYYSYLLRGVQGYNFSATVNDSIGFETVADFITSIKQDLADFLFPIVIKPKYFPDKFDFYDLWDITAMLASDEYITGQGVIITQEQQISARLILATIYSYGKKDGEWPQNFFFDEAEETKRAWEDVYDKDIFNAITNFDWLLQYTVSDMLYDVLIPDITADMRVVSVETRKEEENIIYGDAGIVIYDLVTYEDSYYGMNLLKWLDSSSGPKQYGIRSAIKPNNRVSKEIARERRTESKGCVISGTKITLADGTFKLVQDIQEGDNVLSEGGTVSICSDELVINNRVYAFYGINGEEPSFSLDHALLTNNGWKCMSPDDANAINSHFNIKKLQIGDTVFKFEKFLNGKPVIKVIPVLKIDIKYFGNSGALGYDLHFRSGKPSYFANGFLCLLNYPEITVKRIMKNISNSMSVEESEKFFCLINNNYSLFEKAFGTYAVASFFKKVL